MRGKFVLLPYDKYKIIQTPNAPVSELDRTKEKMSEILEDQILDDSTKNILYNQELMNYLRQRKELADKPLRVQPVYKSVKPPDYVETLYPAFPYAGQIEDEIAPAIPFDATLSTPGALPTPRALAFPTPSTVSQATPRSFATPRTMEDSFATPRARLIVSPRTPGTRDREFDEPIRELQPQQREREKVNRRTLNEAHENRVNELSEELYDYLLSRKRDFGVSANGRIVNPDTRSLYVNAEDQDAKLAIRRILGSLKSHAVPGFARFKLRMVRDPDMRQRIDNALADLDRFRRHIIGSPRVMQQVGRMRMRGMGISRSVRRPSGRVLYKPERWDY